MTIKSIIDTIVSKLIPQSKSFSVGEIIYHYFVVFGGEEVIEHKWRIIEISGDILYVKFMGGVVKVKIEGDYLNCDISENANPGILELPISFYYKKEWKKYSRI
jgi:hypothetical protein